jgi:hypothetical protein
MCDFEQGEKVLVKVPVNLFGLNFQVELPGVVLNTWEIEDFGWQISVEIYGNNGETAERIFNPEDLTLRSNS